MSQPSLKIKRGRPQIHSPKKKYVKLGQGTPIRGQAREMICALRSYFELERENGGPLMDINKVVERTAAALNISRNTVIKIGKEKEKKEKEEELGDAGDRPSDCLETPGKSRARRKTITSPDDFQKDVMRRHIYAYYERKEHPTLKKLHSSLKEANIFNGSESSLRLCIKDLGFEYEKFSTRTILMERNDIVTSRCRYLRAVRRVAFHNIIWLDETWVNASHTLAKGWTDHTSQSTTKAPLGKGGRIIVLHAGSSHGFVPNCLLMFRSRKTGDYHEEMNAAVFTDWFGNSLLKNIAPTSTIVMDNASYHSVITDKAPTNNLKKAGIRSWLEANIVGKYNINLEPDIKKRELMELVTIYKPRTPAYAIDELAKKHGHQVIRLPPYHAHFNPIEHIWAQVKGFVARENKKFSVAEVEKLTREGVMKVTAEDWGRVVTHIQNVTEEAWVKEGIWDECVEQVIISLGPENSSSEDEGESTDSSLGVNPLL